MKIVVLAKEVPDTYTDRKLDLETGLVERPDATSVIDEICERALEAALAYADRAEGVEVRVLTVGPEHAAGSLRKLLALGASGAIHVTDDELLGADLGLTAEVIAAVLQGEGPDLVIAGNQSTDGSAGVVPAMVAELLGLPVLTNLSSLAIAEDSVSGVRVFEHATAHVSVGLPAVVSITEQLPDARMANFKGIMAAKKKPITERRIADLGIDTSAHKHPRVIMTSVEERPPRAEGILLVDDGTAASALATYLAEHSLI